MKSMILCASRNHEPGTVTKVTITNLEKYDEQIFGAYQPKRALDVAKNQLGESGYFLKTGARVIHGNYNGKGFAIQKTEIQ